MTKTQTDYLIVGQGLAGSTLAWALLQAGKSVLLMDKYEFQSSSKVAAGIYNPVTGRKFVKTWLADIIFPFLENYYQQLEKSLQAHFFHPLHSYRPFPNANIQRYFAEPETHENFRYFGTVVSDLPMYKNVVANELGGIVTQHSGWVDLPVLLEAFRRYFQANNLLLSDSFDWAACQLADNTYITATQTIHFEKVIFCEGFLAHQNPWFNWLPFSPVKGEVLTVRFEEKVTLQHIINQGAFVVPLTNDTARLGATYSWHQLDWTPTPTAQEELIDKYKKLMKPRISVLNHLAGVRPATKDRRPFLGLHPTYGQAGIFNGLGSKGVSLAPYFAQHFVDFLVNQKELDPEVNINRFTSLYLGHEK